MTDRISEIEEIVRHFETNRGVGHSLSIVEGARETGAKVVVKSQEQAQHLGLSPDQVVTLNQIGRGRLSGSTDPLVIDNYPLTEMLTYLLDLVRRQQEVIEAARLSLRTSYRHLTNTSRGVQAYHVVEKDNLDRLRHALGKLDQHREVAGEQ